MLTHSPRPWHKPSHHVGSLLLALHHGGKGTEVLNTPVGAGSEKDVIDRHALQLLTGLELHVVKLGEELVTLLFGYALQRGDTFVNSNACPGVGPIGDARGDVLGSIGHLLVEDGIVVAPEFLPFLHGTVPFGTLGGIFASFQIGKSGLVRSYQACPRTHFDGEVRQGQPTLHAHRADGRTGILHGIARGTGRGHLRHDVEGHVLGRGSLGQRAFYVDAHGPGFLLQDAL